MLLPRKRVYRLKEITLTAMRRGGRSIIPSDQIMTEAAYFGTDSESVRTDCQEVPSPMAADSIKCQDEEKSAQVSIDYYCYLQRAGGW